MKYQSWINYSNEILLVNQWTNIDYIECPGNATRCFRNGDDVLQALSVSKVGSFALGQ